MHPTRFNSGRSADCFEDLGKIGAEAGIMLAGSLASKTLLFFYTVFIAKVLAPTDVGLYFLALSVVMLVSALSNLGLNEATVRFVSISKDRKDYGHIKGTVVSSIAISVLGGIMGAALLFFLADHLSTYWFHKPRLAAVLKILSLSLPFENLMRVCLAATRAFKSMRFTAYTENLSWIIMRLLFTLLFLYPLHFGLNGLAMAYVVSSALSAVLAFVFSCRFVPFFDQKITPLFDIKNLLHFSVPTALSTLFFTLNRQVDILILALFVEASDVAVYVVALRLLVPVELIVQAFVPIFQPFVSELYSRNEITRLSVILKIITKWVLITGLPLVLYLSFFPHFFVQFFGKEFIEGELCLQILASAVLFRSFTGMTGTVIYMSGRSDVTLKNNVVLFLAGLTLHYFLVPHFGILGSAVATAVSITCLSALIIAEVYLLIEIHPFRKDLWKPLLSSFISLALLSLPRHYITQISTGVEVLLFCTFMLGHVLLMLSFKFSKEDIHLKHLVEKRLLSLIR